MFNYTPKKYKNGRWRFTLYPFKINLGSITCGKDKAIIHGDDKDLLFGIKVYKSSGMFCNSKLTRTVCINIKIISYNKQLLLNWNGKLTNWVNKRHKHLTWR